MSIWYRLFLNLVKLFLHLCFDLRYEGEENIPPRGGYILCPHHITAWDPLFVAMKVPKKIYFMGKEELFRNKLVGWFLRTVLGAFPVERGSGDMGALDHACDIIKEGKVLGIFPEGTRSKDGKLLKVKLGAAFVAAHTGADLLPVVVTVNDFAKKGLRVRSTVTVKYGKLIRFEELGLSKDDRRGMAKATRVLRAGLEELMEEEA